MGLILTIADIALTVFILKKIFEEFDRHWKKLNDIEQKLNQMKYDMDKRSRG